MDQILPVTTPTPEAHPPCMCNHKPKNIVPPMPPHWVLKQEDNWFTYMIFWTFCGISFGHQGLESFWEACHRNCPPEIWEAERDSLRGRLEHTNIVVRFRRIIDECVIGFDCAGWLRPVCSSVRWRRSAPQILLGTQDYCHIQR